MCALSGEALLTELTFQGARRWNDSVLSLMLDSKPENVASPLAKSRSKW